MASWKRRAVTAGLTFFGLAGTAGSFLFGVMAGEGGPGHVRNIMLGAVCAAVAALSAGGGGVQAERSGRKALAAEARLDYEMRARLAPILYYLGKIATVAQDEDVGQLVGHLMHAIVAAGAGHRGRSGSRCVFFAVKDGRMECVSFSGHEGRRDAAQTTFTDSPNDPAGQAMFRLLNAGEALLAPDVAEAHLQGLPAERSYESLIATAVVAGDNRYGVLTLDAPEPNALGESDLEVAKTLANLLGIGLALSSKDRPDALGDERVTKK